MEKKVNELIDLLNVEIEILNDKEIFLNDSFMYIDIYKQLFSCLNIDNIEETLSNHIYIEVLLKILYKEEIADKLDKNIYTLAYNIFNYKKNDYYEDDIKYISFYKEFKNIINDFKDEYDLLLGKQELLLKNKDKRNRLFECYNRILFCLKNNININNKDLIVIKELLEDNNYDDLDIKIIIENINIYNNKIESKDVNSNYKVIDILKEEINEYKFNSFIPHDKKELLDNYISSLFKDLSSGNDINESIHILDIFDDMEKLYVLINVMNKFIRLMNSCKNNLLEDENYYDKDLKDVILLEFEEYENILIDVEDYYNKLSEETNKIDDEIIENDERQLYFALNSNGTYFIRDLENLSKHDYEKVFNVLEKFKTNQLPNKFITTYEACRNKFKIYRKIKYDNIRIIFRKIEGNKFLILGILEKRETFGQRAYRTIMNRDRDDIYIDDLELNNQYYDEIIEFLSTNKRKGK